MAEEALPPAPTRTTSATWPWVLGLAAAYGAMVLAFGLRHLRHPSGYDATQYLSSGRSIADLGLLGHWSSEAQRTFAYPLFIAVLTKVARHLPVSAAALAVTVQAILWLVAALALAELLRRTAGGPDPTKPASRGPRELAAAALATLLLLDPVLAAYAAETVTESLSLTLFVALLALLGFAQVAAGGRAAAWCLAAAGLAVGLAVEVRPASIILVPALLVGGAAVALARLRGGGAGSWTARTAAVAGLGALAGVGLPMAFEISLNLRVFGRATPFPAQDLGNLQSVYGTLVFKYATYMSSATPRVLYYNPLRHAGDPGGLAFYLLHQPAGVVTLVVHVLSSLNPDYLFPYLYDLHPWYQVPLEAAVAVLVAVGAYGLLRWLWDLRRGGPPRLPAGLGAAAAVAVVCNLAVNSVSAVETRFGFVSLAALSLFAAVALPELAAGGSRRRRRVVAGALAYAVLAVALGAVVSSRMVLGGPQLPPVR